jgi:hypothetical protein
MLEKGNLYADWLNTSNILVQSSPGRLSQYTKVYLRTSLALVLRSGNSKSNSWCERHLIPLECHVEMSL